MPELKLLLEGFHERTNEGFLLSSSVTLVKAEKNILIDTGNFAVRKELVSALERENLSCADIDALILTHMHMDHIANACLFENAVVYHKSEDIRITYRNRPFMKLNASSEICKGVKIIDTPGHVDKHMAVLVEAPQGKIVIAGDAIATRKLLDLQVKPSRCWNIKLYDESRKQILKLADFVIVGHGGMLKVSK